MKTRLTSRQRWLLWGMLLTGTLTAAAWVDGDDGEQAAVEAASPRRAGTARQAPRAAAETPVDRLELPPAPPPSLFSIELEPPTLAELEAAEPPSKLLATRSWYVPPPPPPPEPPKPPPLPFKLIGRVIEGDEPTVFLEQQGRNIIVAKGTRIDNNYLVDSIDKTRIVFLYLPLKKRQELNLGAAN